MPYYDQNYGWYNEDEDPEELREFYFDVQRRSVEKKCSRCGKMVRILPDYDICNSCAEKMEQGYDF